MSRLFKSIKVILIKGSIKRFLVLMRQHFYVTTVNTVFVINIKWTLLSGFIMDIINAHAIRAFTK